MNKFQHRKPFAKPKDFQGILSFESESIPVRFRIRIDARGEIGLLFRVIPLNGRSSFIFREWKGKKNQLAYFNLIGTALDDTKFATSQLRFEKLNLRSGPSRSRVKPEGKCSSGEITYRLAHPRELPILRARLKGFRSFRPHKIDCALGTVRISGIADLKEADTITGKISIQANAQPRDSAEWKRDAESLINHIRFVMSFASSTMLRIPIYEYFRGDTLAVKINSQVRASKSVFPAIHFLNDHEIAEISVRSHFNPPVATKRLFFAIEWLTIEPTYTEMRLFAAMTALECILDSNLEEDEEFILSKKDFTIVRRVLRNGLKQCFSEWESKEETIRELNEKLAEINRRSFLRKIDILAKRWKVPLDDISMVDLQAAKNSRDRVIHRGQYYEDRSEKDPHLWEHVAVVREVATRFIFTALGFKGGYESYVGGHHKSTFPPKKLASETTQE